MGPGGAAGELSDGSALEEPEVARVLEDAMALEDWLIERRLVAPLYAACVARAKVA